MNKIYKVIWSKVKHQYVVVSELAHSNGKQSRTSRNSIRSRIAALVVCGAIAAFGVFSALPTSSAFAAAAETTSGQYIAVAFAKTDTSQIYRWEWYDENCTKFNNDYEWDNRTSTWVKVIGDTREFEDAKGIPHTYKLQTDSKTNKDYWVRDGYSITIENDSRFTAYDQYGKPIAPENTYIIDSQKSDSADSEGLLSSSQVVISDDSKHTTLTGNELNSIDPGIYGGASNSGGTSVPSTWNYYINDNGEGWKDVGGPSDIANMSNFEEVHQQDDGTYNTKQNGSGITVSSDNLYVINGKLGAFFNSNGTVYTGEVYGHNNEVLMTGVENGTYYSYWGTEINDPNTSLSELTVGNLKDVISGINDSIYTAQGDDIKKIDVAKAKDGNGGTIGLVTRGDWKSDGQGNGQYVDTDPVPGTITIRNTDNSGKKGNDVAIRFGSIDEEGQDVEKFTIDAGSKVVGKTGADGTTKANQGDTLTGIEINGQNYKLGGGKTYTDGDGISISQDDTNTISVNTGNGLKIENDKVVANVDGTTVKTNEQGQLTATTLDEKGSGVTATSTYGKDYAVKDTAGNTVTIEDIASASKLGEVAGEAEKHTSVSTNDANLKVENTAQEGDAANYEVTLNKDLAVNSVTAGGENGTVINGNGLTVAGTQYVSAENGLNAGGKTIQNVAEGVGDKDAVNVSQLKKAIGDIDSYSGWTVTTNGGETDEDKAAVGSNGTVDFSADDANITIDQDGTNLKFGLANDLNVNKITTKNMYVTNVDDGNNLSVVNVGYFKDNEKHIMPTMGDASYEASEDGTVTLKYADGSGKEIKDTVAKITGLASDKELADKTAAAKTEVLQGTNVSVTKNDQTADGHTAYTVNAYDTQITGDGNVSVTGGELDENNVRNYNVKLADVITVGTSESAEHPVIIDGTSGQVTGLTNTDLKVEGFGESNRAATEEQLKAAMEGIDEGSYKGWTVSANGENGTTVENGKTVDFSSEDGNVTVTKTTDAGNTKLAFGLADELSVNKVTTSNMYVTNVDKTNDASVVNVGYFNTNEKHIAPTENSSYEASADGTVTLKYADGSGKEIKDTVAKITGLASDKELADKTAAAKTEVLQGTNVSVTKNDQTADGHTAYTVNAYDTQITGDGNVSVTGGELDENNVRNYNVKLADVITVGTSESAEHPVIIDGTSGQVTGLTNTDLKVAGFGESNRAATEEQLKAAMNQIDEGSYKGWTVTTNGGKTEEDKAAVASNGSVDFSNTDKNIIVGQTGTNLTFDLNDNITLGDESGTRIQLNGKPQKDSMISITNKDSDTVFNIAKDGKVSSDNDIIADADNNKYSLSEVGENAVRYNENKSTVALAGTNGTTITNVADGDVSEGSKEAVNGSQLYATNQKVDAGWVATDGANKVNVNPDNNTLKFTGDDKNNITVTAATDEDTKENSIKVELSDNLNVANVNASGDVTTPSADGTKNYSLKNIGKNTEAIYGTKVNGEYVTTVTGTLAATTIQNTSAKFRVDESGNVAAGKVIINATGDISGLSNTTWNGTTNNPSRAATEGQLQQAAAASKTTLSDGINTTVTSKTDTTDGHVDYQVNLDDNVYLGGDNTPENSNIKLDGENGVIGVGSTIALDGRDGTAVIGGVNITTESDEVTGKPVSTVKVNGNVITTNADGTEKYNLNKIGKNTEAIYGTKVNGEYVTTVTGTLAATTIQNTSAKFRVDESGNVAAGKVIINATGDISGLSNTTWNGTTNNPSRAATEGQLKAVSDDVNAGWIATDNSGKEVAVNPDNNKLNFAGDDNITVTATTDENNNNAINVKLNDNITLGDGQSAITLNGSPQNSDDPALSVGTDKFVVAQDGSLSVSDKFNVDAETGNIYAANNSGSAIMMNDDSVALNAGGNGIVASDEGILLNTNGINEDIKLVTKGTSVSVDSNGTTFTNTNTNETTNINGGTINVGDRLMVEEDGSIYATNNNGSTVMINDNGVALNSEGNGVVVSGEGITLNTNGSAVTVDRFNGATFTNTNTGETTNINGDIITTDTVKGLSNTTWDDELATQVANSEELQGTAATQGQLQQAVSAVATEAAKQHTTVSGDDNLTVKSSVNENGGTNYQVTLDDDITLGNPKAGNTEGERSFTINTTNPEGYVPESYKTGSGADFIDENGGFMLFATNTQGYGVFGVTAKGSAWAKDFKTYTTDIYGNNTQYSLNEIGDAVAQMSSYYNEENKKSYTVFSRYLNEGEKDNPFVTVDENATRDIPLALRDDGAVLIGATIKGDDFTDNGIRINAETETTYDENGKEVTNNVATITGLENTTWTPPAPVATFAANDINTTSRAATEAQLNDLYNTVAAYDVNADGTVNYNHITLAGTPYNYGLSRSTDGTPTGGTSITNVAYASGTDGSEAVNVDYLKDAISDAAENGSISTSDQHLVANTETGSNGVYKPNDDGNVNLIVSDEKGNSSTITIGDVASKEDLDNLKDDVGDLDYSKVEGDTIIDGDSVTDAIGKLDNKIENISGTATDADNNTVTGGKINSDGTISLTQKDKDSIKLEGQLTDSGVVQEGTSFDKETGTITITSQDKYSGETSSVKVEGIASTEVVGATNKEDLATAYKDADKDGNATTEYITDSESMVEADVALDHAIQDVANTSYANDMVLSNRIDSVEKRLGNVEERIDKVGAMAAAIANLRTMGFDPEAPTEIAIGVGQYKSETGIAIGVFHYPNQDFMLSASLSSSGDELMGGIGATWKLGRKSAAERAKDEEARHLEQAEEMKKLAQQEKVKAQAQRHAKLLAERQQASQKNA